MNTMELDAARAEIIRSLFEVDNLEALNKVKRTVVRVIKSAKAGTDQDLTPYTMEELNERIDEAEADIVAGRVLTCEQANAEVRKALSWLR